MLRQAKIVATLGPASHSKSVMRRLLKAGVDIVRINLSHGSEKEHRRSVTLVRTVAEELGRHIPVMLDLMGPRYRLDVMPAGDRPIKRGQKVSLGHSSEAVDIPIDNPDILQHLRRGERILIDNGLLELEVSGRQRGRVLARVLVGGDLQSRKGINLPDSDLSFEISGKDQRDIGLAVELDADFLAVSYAGCADDIRVVRRRVHRHGGAVALVAKLERRRAVDHIDEIVEESEAVMVARGDLGVEVPLHEVPVLQKRIIDAGCHFGKPVIVATQMLESMMDRSRPTRAEASDVANAVFDGADALMLSGETAIGQRPVQVVRTMSKIIVEAETYRADRADTVRQELLDVAVSQSPPQSRRRRKSRPVAFPEISNAVARAAVFTARHPRASQIAAFSQSGFTARLIARYRPSVPIRVFTNDARVARRVQLLWGVHPIMLERKPLGPHDLLVLVEGHLRQARLAKLKDYLIVLMGDPISDRPLTNLMRIHQIGA